VKSSGEGMETDCESAAAATIYLDPRIYTREAILRACYWCTALAWVRVPESSTHRIEVKITLKQNTATIDNPNPITIERFVAEFCNSLLDFELRRQVENETSNLRQLILAKAFSESGVLEDEPPGIVVDPVEQKRPSGLLQIITAPGNDRS
jgi:His-Xaa-Ser system protein HxsD